MKKVNWKLIGSDLLAVLAIIWVILTWQEKNDFYKFGAIILVIYLVVNRIGSHYEHYQREKRWF